MANYPKGKGRRKRSGGGSAGKTTAPGSGRRKRKDEQQESAAESLPGIGHNLEQPALSEDQLKSLALQHLPNYQRKLQIKKDADADVRNYAKLIKAEGGQELLDSVLFGVKIDTPEKELREQMRLQAQMRMADWLGKPIGTQAKMFEDEPVQIKPSPDLKRAHMLGELAASKGEQCIPPNNFPPGTEEYNSWIDGWTSRAQIDGGQPGAAH
jgi:hypothetical protein